MDTETRKRNSTIAVDIVVVAVLLAFVVLSFALFARANNQRVLAQSTQIIESLSREAAARLEEMLDLCEDNLRMMAQLGSLEEIAMDSPEALQQMTDNSTFDYVEFITPDGMDHTADGQTADLSDRDYVIDGLQGNSGRSLVRESRITHETLFIFYSPVMQNGEIAGVLSGVLRGETVQQVLISEFSGMEGNMYLMERSGDIIVSTKSANATGNFLDRMRENQELDAEELRKLEETLDSSNDVNEETFYYPGTQGTGSACITVLQDGTMALVETFSSTTTKAMTDEANAAGLQLELSLGAAFLVYVAYLIIKGQIQRRHMRAENEKLKDQGAQLQDENQQLQDESRRNAGIVHAATKLFSRFSYVNFKEDTYEHLRNNIGDAPTKGTYSELVQYLSGKYVPEEDGGEPMGVKIAREYVQSHLTADVPYLQFEYQIDMNGQRWENVSLLPLERDEQGMVTEVLYAIQDVTALKEQEQRIRMALKSASDAAEAANHAKSDFLARMSHDIRTPMNAIMGMTAVAAMHMDDPERLSDCLSKITISSRHLLALINDVLDMSKIESGKVTLSEEPFTIPELVDSVDTIIRAQVRAKKQKLRIQIMDVVHEDVIGDSLRLRQVFVNILGNSVKFTPEGGQLVLTIRELPSTVHDMAQFEFRFEDNGIGMEQEFLKTIFEPFSRSERPESAKTEGTGLGMSITRNIVRMMEGDIQVESQLGVGTCFTVRVHLKLQNSDAENVEELADLRILVADDEQDAAITTVETLRSIGMDAEYVLGGIPAVERVKQVHDTAEDFAVVILDWKMPDKDGVETTREIRQEVGSDVPIIILSAYDWTDIEQEARDAGVHAFVEKPLFRSRLIYALKSVLAQGSAAQKTSGSELDEADFSGKRVLLVEDNELNREIAVELLSCIGIQVEEAEDGAQAVRMVSQAPQGYYDLVFMDIQMPVLDGYGATRQIRQLETQRPGTTTLPIIAMTANAFADDIREAKEAGMNGHISKPVEIPKMVEILEQWLR